MVAPTTRWAAAAASLAGMRAISSAPIESLTIALFRRSSSMLATPPSMCGAVTTKSSSSSAAGVSSTAISVVCSAMTFTVSTVCVLNLV